MPTSSRKNEPVWSEARKHWRIDVQSHGRRKSFYSPLPGKKGKIECGYKADEWLSDATADGKRNPRLETLWEEHLADVKRTTGSGNHVKTEQVGRLYLLPKLKLKRTGEITIQDWQDRITEAYEKGLSKKTCSNIRGAITSLYKYAFKNNVIMQRPEFLSVPRDAPVAERRILQPEQIQTLFSVDWITHHGKEKKCWLIHCWRFDALTGLRRGELAGLKWEDIDGNVLHISRSINAQREETRGKNDNARRYIVLSPTMQTVLEEQRALLKSEGLISPWVFPDESGTCINPDHIYKRWYRYRKQHGIESSIHELRHTMISIVSPEVPDALLKPIVGHSKAMDTDQYRHVVDGNAERAAALIEDVYARILNPTQKCGKK